MFTNFYYLIFSRREERKQKDRNETNNTKEMNCCLEQLMKTKIFKEKINIIITYNGKRTDKYVL